MVWRVLGFGGRPNPLVFSRAASFASRVAQAMLGADRPHDQRRSGLHAPGRLQLYVDDPTLVARGTAEQVQVSFDVVLLLWLSLGIPLAWKKGQTFDESESHRWIGILYFITKQGALMRLPEDFVAELLKLLEAVSKVDGTISENEADVLVGKAARVAHVVPSAKPFVASLWGALAGARRAAVAGVREAPPGRMPCRRFCFAASWLRALLKEDGSAPMPLGRLVTPRPPPSATRSGWWVEFDASPYGGGAVLKNPEGIAVEYFAVVWDGAEAIHLNVAIEDPAYQTFWEFATLFLVLMVWGDKFVEESLLILGDNTAALSNALSLKGRGCLLAVAREIAWRQARRKWCFETGHLPSEHNVIADALSRIVDPKGKAWPSLALSVAEAVQPPKLQDLWLAHPR